MRARYFAFCMDTRGYIGGAAPRESGRSGPATSRQRRLLTSAL